MVTERPTKKIVGLFYAVIFCTFGNDKILFLKKRKITYYFMIEDFLYYVWQYRTYHIPLVSAGGKPIRVIDVGIRNYDSGPDFSAAKVEIGDTIWAGNVEMHIKSSDWIRHGHNTNSAYDSVILHVVYEHDMDIVSQGGNHLDVLELKAYIKADQYIRYKKLVASHSWIACSLQLASISYIKIYSWLDRLLIERLERKTEGIEQLLELNNNNWEQVFYIALARNFGFNTNADSFEQLAKNTPIEILARYKDNIFQLEALLFGQSALINDYLQDEYAQSLLQEYDFLKSKHNLQSISHYQWKFMRMRPVNFPSIRIAQFAQLIHKSTHLFSRIIEAESLADLSSLFTLNVSPYWQTHYVFGKKSKFSIKSFGDSSFNLVLINTIVPFLFVYAKHQDNEDLRDKALMFLQHTKPENNAIIKSFAKEGIQAHNAMHSQALLQLKKEYCSKNRCLSCAIGLQLIKGD